MTAAIAATASTAVATAAHWEATIIAGSPVATRTCRRCQGTGSTVYTWNNFGICRLCGGHGVVPAYTKVQRAAIDQRAADHRAAHVALAPALKALPRNDRHLAEDAVMHLREFAPDRFDKMTASVLAGRLDAVTAALVTYATEANIYASWNQN